MSLHFHWIHFVLIVRRVNVSERNVFSNWFKAYSSLRRNCLSNALLHKWFTLISFHQSLYFLPRLLFNDLSLIAPLFTIHMCTHSLEPRSYMYIFLIQDVCLIASENSSMTSVSPALRLCCRCTLIENLFWSFLFLLCHFHSITTAPTRKTIQDSLASRLVLCALHRKPNLTLV